MNRPTTARSAREPAKKFSLLFFCARRIFSVKRKRKLFCRLLLLTEQVVGLRCGLGFAKTIFWGKGFGKTSAEFSRPQKGVWGMNAGGIPNSFWWFSKWRKMAIMSL